MDLRSTVPASLYLEFCDLEPLGTDLLVVKPVLGRCSEAKPLVRIGPDLVPRFRQHQFWTEQFAQPGVIKPHLSSLVSPASLACGVGLQPVALQATTNLGRWIPLAAGMAARLAGAGRACSWRSVACRIKLRTLA